MISAFHRSYLLMGQNTRWDQPNHDATLFPLFDRSLAPLLQKETELVLEHVVSTDGTFQDFFTTPVAYVNAQTAPLYGLAAADFGTDLEETTLDASVRPGFLTRVGFLNAYSSFSRSSPILRGAFIANQVLATLVGTPPAGAAQAPLPTGAELDTNRKQVDAQTSGAACVGCHHTFINPPGYVLENYDAVGSWQTNEASNGVPIDTKVDMEIDGEVVHLENAAELMAKLATSTGAMHRYAERWVSYAFERDANPLDSCTVNDLATKIRGGGYSVMSLVADLTRAESFRVRAVDSGVLQ